MTHPPDFGSKTDFIFAQECLRFRKPGVLWMHALINTTLEIARNGSACVFSSHYSHRVLRLNFDLRNFFANIYF